MSNFERGALVGLVLGFVLVEYAEAQSYSVDAAGFTATPGFAGGGGAFPDDIFFAPTGAVPPAPPIPPLGLLGSGPAIEVNGISYGRPLSQFSVTAPAHFSVDAASISALGTASGIEFSNPAGSEASSDVFFSSFTGTNALAFDGDGVATFPNPPALPLALAEPATQPPPSPPFPPRFDDLDGFDLRSPTPLLASPTGVVYFSVDATTAASGVYGPGVSGADIFIGDGSGMTIYDAPSAGVGTLPLAPGGVPQPYAPEAALGFSLLGNDIDALVVFDNGDLLYSPGIDIVVFSLAPGSPYLGALDPISGLPIEPSDILIDGGSAVSILGGAVPVPAILHPGESLGLLTARSTMGGQVDNLNALDLVVPEPTSMVLASIAMLLMLGAAVFRKTPRATK